MNKVHAAIITHIRSAARGQNDTVAKHIYDLPDERIVRMMFSNYRGRDHDARGLRLTNFGLQVMRTYFEAYEVAMPDGYSVRTPDLLYLDHRCTLPYYCSAEKLVVFESDLGVILALADGDISTLIAMEAS